MSAPAWIITPNERGATLQLCCITLRASADGWWRVCLATTSSPEEPFGKVVRYPEATTLRRAMEAAFEAARQLLNTDLAHAIEARRILP